MAAGNVELIERLHRLWSGGPESDIRAVYDRQFVAWWPESSEFPVRRGRSGVLRALRRIRTAFPDWREDILDLIATGDRVVTRYQSRGTHTGPFWGLPPTGRTTAIEEISIYQIEGGAVVRQWCRFDELARLRQLGLAAPEPTR